MLIKGTLVSPVAFAVRKLQLNFDLLTTLRINFNRRMDNQSPVQYVREEITNSLANYDSCIVEVWKWISNFIPHFVMDVITSTYAGINMN